MSKRMFVVWAVTSCLVGCIPLHKKSDSTAAKKEEEPKEHVAEAPEAVTFPDGEKALGHAAPVWAKDFAKPPPTIKRAYLMDSDWGMTRADNNAIIGRHARTVLFYKGGETSHCYQALCNLREEEQGGSWGKPYLECIGEYTTRVVCESVDGLRGAEL